MAASATANFSLTLTGSISIITARHSGCHAGYLISSVRSWIGSATPGLLGAPSTVSSMFGFLLDAPYLLFDCAPAGKGPYGRAFPMRLLHPIAPVFPIQAECWVTLGCGNACS